MHHLRRNAAPPKIRDTISLLRNAIRRLEDGEYEAATWRLADALGDLGEDLHEMVPGKDFMGVDYPTGRGYMIVVRGPWRTFR